jgi:hypothetical protein
MHTLACDEFIVQLFEEDGFIAISVISLICATIIVGTITGAIASIFKTRAKEMTRRELAAYVAEGSLRPEDAVAVLNGGKNAHV